MKRFIVLVAAGALVLAACGDDGNDDQSESTRSTAPASPRSSAPPTSAAARGPATIAAADSSLGSIIVDADGKTLYLFANDMGTTSAVPANLLAAWPPLIASGEPVAGAGIDASKLSTAEQANGETWVTYNDHPLYRFANDAAPGDTNGQGLGNVWYVVSAAGERIG